MTDLNSKRTLGGPFEMPSYGDAASNAMWDMPWLWDDDDPHPGLETLKKANTLTFPDHAYAKQEKTIAPGTAGLRGDNPLKGNEQLDVNIRFSKPSLNANDGGLMSNFSADSRQNMTGQIGTSLYAGKNADGQRLTEKYDQLNSYRDQRQTRTNETLLNARKQTEVIVSPKMGSSPVSQALSSVASTRHNQGLEYLPAMQGYLHYGRMEGIEGSNEAEADFSRKMTGLVADTTKEAYRSHYEPVIRSMDGAEASYSKRYPENPQYYETLGQRLVEPGTQAIEKVESHNEVTDEDREMSDQWMNGLDVSRARHAVIGSGTLVAIDKLLPQKDGIVNNQRAFDRHIEQNNQKSKIREGRARMISATQLKGENPGETWKNLKRWCSETLFGEYAIDLALMVGTRGRTGTPLRVMKTMSAVASHSDRKQQDWDAIENAKINQNLRFGEDESEAHSRLNEMADRLDQNSSTAVKLLIKIIPDQMRQDFLETYDGVRKDW